MKVDIYEHQSCVFVLCWCFKEVAFLMALFPLFLEKRCFEELISMLHVQVNEMKSMSSALQKLDASGK